jgi:hypothetical protein
MFNNNKMSGSDTESEPEITEFEVFVASLEGKSEKTIKTYKQQYNKLRQQLDKDIHESSQNKIIEIAGEQENNNTKQARLNIGILVRKLYNYDTKELEKQRDVWKGNIKEDIKKKNETSSLPSYNDLLEYTDYLYENNKWVEYVINYLLINFQVRNEDLDFQIVDKKSDTKDDSKNYIWMARDKIVYIRNNYKTSKTYGMKMNTIKDKEFITAMKRIKARGDTLVPNPDNLGYWIRKATLDSIGEGAYFKIIVNAYKGNLQEIKKMSESRGTDLKTITESYSLDNV